MKLPVLFLLFACSPLVWGLTPSRAQIAAEPTNRVVRPDTPANQRLLTAIEAGDLPGVQAALQSGASADAEVGVEIPAMDVPPLPAQSFANPESFTVLATDSLLRGHDNTLTIFRLLLHNEPVSSFTNPQKSVGLMCSAVDMSDLDSVRWLVARGVSINPPPYGAGILAIALDSSGSVRIKTPSPLMSFLLDHGAEVNKANLDGGTPLMWAAEYGQTGVVQALLAHGADPALRDKSGLTALDWAARMGRDAAAALLRDRSPMDIQEAAQFGDVLRLKAHLDVGENPNAPDATGTTPLMKAAQAGSLATARLLLDRGADVKHQRPDGTTALHLAALSGSASMAALLLDRGADINAAAGNPGSFQTPLICAVEQVQADAVSLLLKRGANLKHGQGEAALDITLSRAGEAYRPNLRGRLQHPQLGNDAILDAWGQIIDLLLGAGVDVRSKSSHALFLAASGGQGEIVENLLNKGADVNGRGKFTPNDSRATDNGETALMGAIEGWKRVCIASIDIKPSKGNQDNPAVVSAWQSFNLLLAHGADVNLSSAYAVTPLMLCVSLDQQTLAEMLLTRGAKIDAADMNGKTALMREVSRRRPLFAAWLLAHHAAVNRRDKQGRTALMLTVDDGMNDSFRTRASWAWTKSDNAGHPITFDGKPHPVPQKDLPNRDGHPDVVRLLLSHGASVNAVALDGTTALSLARKENFVSVVALLLAAGARR